MILEPSVPSTVCARAARPSTVCPYPPQCVRVARSMPGKQALPNRLSWRGCQDRPRLWHSENKFVTFVFLLCKWGESPHIEGLSGYWSRHEIARSELTLGDNGGKVNQFLIFWVQFLRNFGSKASKILKIRTEISHLQVNSLHAIPWRLQYRIMKPLLPWSMHLRAHFPDTAE